MYPGDPAVRVRHVMRMAAGDIADVTALDMPAHAGTHVDAPAHVLPGGAGVEAARPQALIGRARVVAVPPDAPAVDAAMVTGWALGPDDVRILVRTAAPGRYPPHDGPGLTPEAAGVLAAHGALLVGIDTMSIAAAGDPLPAHRALLRAGVVVLEGLRLGQAPPGAYELVCLPLLIPGADGAPARAVLRPTAP